MTHGAPRIVNNVSCVTRISHGSHFSWQAQYLVSLDNDTDVAPRIVNNVSFVGCAPFSANFSHILDGHFSWQAQYLVSLDYDTCCSAHCK